MDYEKNQPLHRLMFDSWSVMPTSRKIDDCGRFGWDSPLINNLLEDLTIAIRSLQTQFPALGKAVIKRTLKGFHVVFPDSKLPFWMVDYLTQKCPHDFGQRFWSQMHQRVTLRIGDKPITRTKGRNYNVRIAHRIIRDRPQIIRIIYPDGKVLYRKEIEERFGDV